MRCKRIRTACAAALLSGCMVFGSTFSAMAQEIEPMTEAETSVVIEENLGEVIEETIQAAPEETATVEESVIETENIEVTGLLTPEGNMNLVDDITQDDSGLQYMTVTTRDGSCFYIIIDRSTDKENVYFLNPVDAADLLKLLNEDEKKEYKESQAEKEQQSAVIQPAESVQEQKQPGTNRISALITFGIVTVIGAVIIGTYYFLKIRPGRNGVDQEREFYDDEGYEDIEEEENEE